MPYLDRFLSLNIHLQSSFHFLFCLSHYAFLFLSTVIVSATCISHSAGWLHDKDNTLEEQAMYSSLMTSSLHVLQSCDRRRRETDVWVSSNDPGLMLIRRCWWCMRSNKRGGGRGGELHVAVRTNSQLHRIRTWLLRLMNEGCKLLPAVLYYLRVLATGNYTRVWAKDRL